MLKKADKLHSLKNLVLKANRSEIASISTIVTKILEVIKDPNASANQLRDIIEVDPPLCAKVLKRSNSAFYGVARTIGSIQQAIVFLGFSTIKELCLSLTVGTLFKGDKETGGYSRKKLWKHSLTVSLCCKNIYRCEFQDPGDSIYSTALIHDLGIIVEEQLLKSFFTKMITQVYEEHIPIDIAETKMFGYNHADVCREITKLWNFPPEIRTPLAYHHRPLAVDPAYAKPTKVLYIADYICHKNNVGLDCCIDLNEETYQKCLDSLGISGKAVEIVFEDVCAEIAKLEDAGELYI